MRVLLINDYGGRFAGAEVITLAMRDRLRARGHESRLRRAGYIVGAPVIPLMNLPRSLRDSARSAPPTAIAASLPSILLHLAARGAGEVAAYITGKEGDEEFLASHEFTHRHAKGERS